ncbi:WG repeat-containing protein [Mucilaginibacter sp. ZT4R22]|uniref:WG repeat-containing protein n=1 Tax=Mucilaginibacter pankratovii TaxID=2772110 RepID=A0ABR7X1G2_9SPHI|nr:WG repeat-containing protein [Mucilaginibacter pankratovii]MBD1367534.1 WG repeat-containing protein [Mucilaginibacter pankratovii]
MKKILIIPLLLLCNVIKAQVPGQQGSAGNVRGDIDIPIPDDSTKPQDRNAGYYQKDGKYGFVYPADVKQAAIYDKIDFSSNNGFIVKKDGAYGIADKKGQVIGKIEYDSIGSMYPKGYILKKNDKYGTLAADGSKVLSVKYDKILATTDFVSFAQNRGGKIQMLFNDNEKAFSAPIEYAAMYANMVIIKANGKFGAVKNQVIIPLLYDSIFVADREINTVIKPAKRVIKAPWPIDKNKSYQVVTLLTLQNSNKYGLANADGSIIYPVDNDAVYNQEMYRYYSVKKGNLFGVYFIDSKVKTPIELDMVYADGVGYVMANKNKKGGVFNLQGKQIVPFEYDPGFIMQYRIGFGVKKNQKKGIVSKDGAVLVQPIYDDVDPFYETAMNDLVKVRLGEKYGIVNLKGQTVIPVEFDWIGEEKGLLKVVTADKRFGLYEKTGKVVIPADYKWIIDSDTENSNVIILKKANNTYNFLNKNTQQALLKESVSSYGYVNTQDGLYNPFSSGGKLLLLLKAKSGKVGMLNEITGALDVPMIYDDIIQRFEGGKHTYYSVRKGQKYGLIDDANKVVIPLLYDAIDISLVYPDDYTKMPSTYTIIVAKAGKFGAVNLENRVVIPFQYSNLQRLSQNGLYKAKTGGSYQIITARNQVINKGPFDEVANYEATAAYSNAYQALTFYKGNMRVVNDKGAFTTAAVPMAAHKGYKTFDELKWALIKALDSKDDALLKDFADKVAPSEHILFYLKENAFSKRPLQGMDIDAVRARYYTDLLNFKQRYWNGSSGLPYKRESLTDVADYTRADNGFVTNARRADHAFGDTRFMEKLLRNAIKVNGYWISTYFMTRNFER